MTDGGERGEGERGAEPTGAPPPGPTVPPPVWGQPGAPSGAPSGPPSDGADYPGGTGWGAAPAGATGAVPMPGTRRRFPLGLRGLVALGVAGFAVVGFLSQADRDDSGAISESGTLDVEDLEIGDCFNDPIAEGATEAEIADVDAVPCADPHDLEVFHVVDHPAGPDDAYVGQEELRTFAEQSCVAAFEPYVGRDYQESEVYLNSVSPSDETWEQGDREVICALYVPDEQVTGTLRDSGR